MRRTWANTLCRTRTFGMVVVWCAMVAVVPAPTASAQANVSVDQVIGRARAMVENGEGRAGRLLLDSMVQQAASGSTALGEVLYWRGLLSESGIGAERDWRQLLLEVPSSPRAEDALLRLAQLQLLRGRPADSRVFLDRLVRDYADPGSQARAHFWLAKGWFDSNDIPRGCGALEIARGAAPSSAVELRALVDDMSSRCRGVTAVAPTSPSSTPAALPPIPPPATATAAAPPAAAATTTGGVPAGARYSVQLAAYARLDPAQAMVRRLATQNVDARVDGTVAPFRVRTGYFRTQAEAAARLAEFTRTGQEGFVAELTP